MFELKIFFMKLSVCVVNYHSESQLRNFLESFMDYRPECLHEVIVVNNGSEDQNLKKTLKDQFGELVTVISPSKNIGFGAAQNKAVKKSKGEYIFLCNPDMEFEDHCLNGMLEFAEELDDFGVIGPQLLYSDGEVQESRRRFPKFTDLVVKRLGLAKLFKKKDEAVFDERYRFE